MRTPAGDPTIQRHVVVRLALATGLLLLVPLIAMQLTDEVVWTAADFVVMGALLFGGGLGFVLVTRRAGQHRALAGIAILGALLWVWAELAVRVFTNLGS